MRQEPNGSRPPKLLAARFLDYRTIPIVVLLLAMVGLDVAIATILEVRDEELAGFMIGSTFSQIVLCAVWCSLAPFHLGTRFISGTMVLGFVTLCMFRCAQRDAGGPNSSTMALALAAAMVVQWVLYQIPLWHMRLQGWRLAAGGTHVAQDNDVQFGIRQMAVWTTIVATFFAIFRLLFKNSGMTAPDGGMDGLAIAMFWTLALGNSLLVLPLIYACLSRERMFVWFVIAIPWTLGVTWIEITFLNGSGGVDPEFFLILNLVQVVAVVVTLLLVRLAGFRLEQTSTS